MLGKPRGPGDEYQDWEYPDPRDVEDLAEIPVVEEPRTQGRGLSWLKLLVMGVLIVSLLGSLMVPLLGSIGGGATPAEVAPGGAVDEEAAAYRAWLEQSVDSALREWGAGDQAQFLGVQFDISGTDPIVGLRVDGLDPTSDSAKFAMQSYSIAVLGRIFDDPRADSATLFWYSLVADDGSGSGRLQGAMVVGIVRQTADVIEWSNLGAGDLADAVDLYQELAAEAQEPA